MEVRKDGAWRTINTAEAYVGGAWRTLKYVEGYIGGAWRTIASFIQPLTLSVPATRNNDAESSTVTVHVPATPSGGLGPFTYAWTVLSFANATTVTLSPASSATTNVTATGVSQSTPATASVRCVCTDSLGSTASATASCTFQHLPPGTGGA
jgi:hypothetical protein